MRSAATSARFSFTYLWTPDVEATLRFYERAFGLPVRRAARDGDWGLVGDPGHPLGIEGHHLAPERAGGRFPDTYVRGQPAGFYLVLDVAELESAFRRAVDAGCEVLSPPERTAVGNRVAWVRDPNGVVVELLQWPNRKPAATRVEQLLLAGAVPLVLGSLATSAALLADGRPGRICWLAVPALGLAMGWCAWLGALGGAWRTRAWRWRRGLLAAGLFGALAALGLAGSVARLAAG